MNWMLSRRSLLAACIASPGLQAAAVVTATLRRETQNAFDNYVRGREADLAGRYAGRTAFLWSAESLDRMARLERGEVLTAARGAQNGRQVPHGLIHDWTGAVLLPGSSLDQVLALVQNYDAHERIYEPEVMRSHLRKRQGDLFQVYLRLRKQKILTVVLDTEHEVRYQDIGNYRVYSHSRTTKVEEVQDMGTPSEKRLPEGAGHGFLWRLNSYWRFQQVQGGVVMECDAVSLTRDVPTGLGWMINPVIRELPRESLTSTLLATRKAMGVSRRAG